MQEHLASVTEQEREAWAKQVSTEDRKILDYFSVERGIFNVFSENGLKSIWQYNEEAVAQFEAICRLIQYPVQTIFIDTPDGAKRTQFVPNAYSILRSRLSKAISANRYKR